MLYKIGAKIEPCTTPFLSLWGLLVCPSLMWRTKDLEFSSSMIKSVTCRADHYFATLISVPGAILYHKQLSDLGRPHLLIFLSWQLC